MSGKKTTIVYDGECHFCIEQVGKIKRMDRERQFDYLPRQSPDLDRRFPALKTMNFEEGMRVVDPEGSIYIGADAVFQIARRLPGTRMIAWLYHVPVLKQFARRTYKWIAANRKKLGRTCEDNACKLSPVDHNISGER